MRVLWTVLILVLLTPGCAEFQDHRYRIENRLRAHRAWAECGAPSASQVGVTDHYRRGWLAGYYEVLTGGPDLPPVVPPKQYWAPEYQTPEGQAAISEWYRGFQFGAMAATSSPIRREIPFTLADPEPPQFPGFESAQIPDVHPETIDELPQLPDLPRYIVPEPMQDDTGIGQPPDHEEFLPPVSASPRQEQRRTLGPAFPQPRAAHDPTRRDADEKILPVSAQHSVPRPQVSWRGETKMCTKPIFHSAPPPPCRITPFHICRKGPPPPCRKLEPQSPPRRQISDTSDSTPVPSRRSAASDRGPNATMATNGPSTRNSPVRTIRISSLPASNAMAVDPSASSEGVAITACATTLIQARANRPGPVLRQR